MTGTSLLMTAIATIFLRNQLRPIRRLAHAAEEYGKGRIIPYRPAGAIEIRSAGAAFLDMRGRIERQNDQRNQMLSGISHDLRNILTTSQIFADRLETSADPAVRRAAPKLVNSISRAVNLCETTLAFGKAEEPAPTLSRFNLSALVTEVTEGEAMAADRPADCEPVEFLTDIPASLSIRADRDQLFRVLSNLVRNARQAIEATRKPGTIEIGAGEDENDWWIRIGDTGPGLPPKAREYLFQPFSGGSRKGGTGLGLAIAADLVRNHGGRLELVRSDEEGTQFLLLLPRELVGISPRTAAAEAIAAAEIEERTVDEDITVVFEYPYLNGIMRIVKEDNPAIISQKFEMDCEMTLRIRKGEAERLKNRLLKVETAYLKE